MDKASIPDRTRAAIILGWFALRIVVALFAGLLIYADPEGNLELAGFLLGLLVATHLIWHLIRIINKLGAALGNKRPLDPP